MGNDWEQHIGDNQLVYGMPKHMVATANQDGGQVIRHPDDGKYYWTVHPKPGACTDCKAMSGKIFFSEPKRPHRNCKCEIRKHETEKTNKVKKGNILGWASPTAFERFTARKRIEVVVVNQGIALLPGAWVRTNLAGEQSCHIPGIGRKHSFFFETPADGALDWMVWIAVHGAENTTLKYNIYYDEIE